MYQLLKKPHSVDQQKLRASTDWASFYCTDSYSASPDNFISHRADMPSETYKRSEIMVNSRCG